MVEQAGSRFELMYKVQRGELSAEEAEETAAQTGLPCLEYTDWTKHHPRDQIRWTLAMTLAWIAWREFECVAEFDRAFLSYFSAWCERRCPFPTTHDAARFRPVPFLKGKREPWVTSAHVRAVLAVGDDESADGDGELCGVTPLEFAPWHSLRAAAVDGLVTAEAAPFGGGAPQEIRSIEWTGLEVEYSSDLRDEHFVHAKPGTALPRVHAYEGMLFRPAEVMSVWLERGQVLASGPLVAPTPRIRANFQALAQQYFSDHGEAPSEAVWLSWRQDLHISRKSARKLQRDWPTQLRRGVGTASKSAGK